MSDSKSLIGQCVESVRSALGRNARDAVPSSHWPGLTLYHFPACPYCRRVQRALGKLGVEIEQRDILADPDNAAELMRGGGKRQVPCLRIEHGGQDDEWLYESADIIDYLQQEPVRRNRATDHPASP